MEFNYEQKYLLLSEYLTDGLKCSRVTIYFLSSNINLMKTVVLVVCVSVTAIVQKSSLGQSYVQKHRAEVNTKLDRK